MREMRVKKAFVTDVWTSERAADRGVRGEVGRGSCSARLLV